MLNIFGKQTMDENEFWKILSLFDWEYEGDDGKVLKKAINYLSQKSNDEIYEFYEIMSKLLYNLDGIEYAKNIGENSYGAKDTCFSVDWFLYTRCVVVANGKDYYYGVLNNPKNMPKEIEFESLLYIAPNAYETKNNSAFDYIAKCSFETFSNEDGWK